MMEHVLKAVREAPIIPVITLNHEDHAEPLANALIDAGLQVLEVTLRTKAALGGIRIMADCCPDAVVAAGTVLSSNDFNTAVQAGARLVISPGATPDLLAAAAESAIPFMPGVATASEAMVASTYGFDVLKFFPAGASGGVAALKGFAGPLSKLKFCPTGGVNKENMRDYLALPNVIAVGGSWMVPPELVEAGRFDEVKDLAMAAVEGARHG